MPVGDEVHTSLHRTRIEKKTTVFGAVAGIGSYLHHPLVSWYSYDCYLSLSFLFPLSMLQVDA
jgi:hypothetical protein